MVYKSIPLHPKSILFFVNCFLLFAMCFPSFVYTILLVSSCFLIIPIGNRKKQLEPIAFLSFPARIDLVPAVIALECNGFDMFYRGIVFSEKKKDNYCKGTD